MKATTANNFYTKENERRLLVSLLLGVALMVVLYASFLFLAVQGAMSQRAAFKESQQLHKEIVALESSYGTLKDTVTLARASELGLVPLEATRYASRDESPRFTLLTE